jgi:hypothetical protein
MPLKLLSEMITEVLIPSKSSIKHLNLSENKLNMRSFKEYSNEIVDNLCIYLHENDKLVHLDISGMSFCPVEGHLLKICGMISSSSDSLLAVHINDNQIKANEELYDEILDLFGLKQIEKNKIFKQNRPIHDASYLRQVV